MWEIVRRVPNSRKTTGEGMLAMYAPRWCRPVVMVSAAADFAWGASLGQEDGGFNGVNLGEMEICHLGLGS